jgi:hypothetical protein
MITESRRDFTPAEYARYRRKSISDIYHLFERIMLRGLPPGAIFYATFGIMSLYGNGLPSNKHASLVLISIGISAAFVALTSWVCLPAIRAALRSHAALRSAQVIVMHVQIARNWEYESAAAGFKPCYILDAGPEQFLIMRGEDLWIHNPAFDAANKRDVNVPWLFPNDSFIVEYDSVFGRRISLTVKGNYLPPEWKVEFGEWMLPTCDRLVKGSLENAAEDLRTLAINEHQVGWYRDRC